MSLPPPPSITSAPVPPARLSFPAPARIVSIPPRPSIETFDVVFMSIISFPAVPEIAVTPSSAKASKPPPVPAPKPLTVLTSMAEISEAPKSTAPVGLDPS